jgi:flagellar hook-basal body complex protein FliE
MGNPINNIGFHVPGLIEKSGVSAGQGALPKEAQSAQFTEMLSNLLSEVNAIHGDSAQIQQAFMEGEPVELHQVMIKAREAGIATDLLLEIRNKLLNAYNEIMRMPM